MNSDYMLRDEMEEELRQLLPDDRRSIVTLVGRGGIGKTSLALKVIHDILNNSRFEGIVWLSSSDVDLQLSGPKPVFPSVVSMDDISKNYASLVLQEEKLKDKEFNARAFFEQQLQESDLGPCLFVFDNFETTDSPVEVFTWIDTFIRLPNKALITTRLRDFKGDYPPDVKGMTDEEARRLIKQTAAALGADAHLNSKYVNELIAQSEGHPYVIKILLGEVAKMKKAASVPHVLAGTGDILTALFERTYAALSPCAKRAQSSDIPYSDLSDIANKLNQFLRDHGTEIDPFPKGALAQRILNVLIERQNEAGADDFSRMTWLAIHLNKREDAANFVNAGLDIDSRQPPPTENRRRAGFERGHIGERMISDLVSKRTRKDVRVGWTLREIEMGFEAADIDCDRNHEPDVSGQRRAFIEQYYRTPDFTNPYEVKRLLAPAKASSNALRATGPSPTDVRKRSASFVSKMEIVEVRVLPRISDIPGSPFITVRQSSPSEYHT